MFLHQAAAIINNHPAKVRASSDLIVHKLAIRDLLVQKLEQLGDIGICAACRSIKASLKGAKRNRNLLNSPSVPSKHRTSVFPAWTGPFTCSTCFDSTIVRIVEVCYSVVGRKERMGGVLVSGKTEDKHKNVIEDPRGATKWPY